jgi:hypothetical protein
MLAPDGPAEGKGSWELSFSSFFLALILGGLGFAIHILWWIALVVLVIWLIGFVVRMGEGTSRGRWYRW